MGIARNYCRANNIVVDREVELGRGPVDFKFLNGYIHRAQLEIKKLHSGKFLNGIINQLPSYLISDDCQDGWYVSIRYRPVGKSRQWSWRLPHILQRTAEKTGKRLRSRIVNGMPKRSASNIKS
jgi:hypothetical protein